MSRRVASVTAPAPQEALVGTSGNPTLPLGLERELATELARAGAVDAAPEELVLFDVTAEDYWADPQAVLDPKRRDEAVGFGIDAALVTPLLLAIATPVVRYLAAQAGEAIKEAAGPRLTGLLRRWLRLEDAPPAGADEPSVTLTAEQAGHVRDIALEQATALGLEEGQARLLADAVAGRALAGGG